MQYLELRSLLKGAIKGRPGKERSVSKCCPIIVDDELKGSVAVLHDITEMNRLSEELRQAKQIIRKLEAKYTLMI